MARSTLVQYGRNRKGKLVQTSKTVVKGKGADAAQAMQAAGISKTKTKGFLKAQQQQNQHTERMADIANKAATRQAAIAQVGVLANKAINTAGKSFNSNITKQSTSPATVQTLVNGGAEQASNSRDEDEDEDGYSNIA